MSHSLNTFIEIIKKRKTSKFFRILQLFGTLQKMIDTEPQVKEAIISALSIFGHIFANESFDWTSERSAENYLIKNWDKTTTTCELELIKEQYRCKSGVIDVLAKDKEGNYVVIELKQTGNIEHAIGQILRYIVDIKEEKGVKPKGIIVTETCTEKEREMVEYVPDIQLQTTHIKGEATGEQQLYIFCDIIDHFMILWGKWTYRKFLLQNKEKYNNKMIEALGKVVREGNWGIVFDILTQIIYQVSNP